MSFWLPIECSDQVRFLMNRPFPKRGGVPAWTVSAHQEPAESRGSVTVRLQMQTEYSVHEQIRGHLISPSLTCMTGYWVSDPSRCRWHGRSARWVLASQLRSPRASAIVQTQSWTRMAATHINRHCRGREQQERGQ